MAITRKNSKSNKRMSKNTKKTSKRSNSSKRNVSKNRKVRKTRKSVKGVRKMKGGSGDIITDVNQLVVGNNYKFIDGKDLGKYLKTEKKTMSFYGYNNNNRPENQVEDLYYFEKLETSKNLLVSFDTIPPYLKKTQIINKIKDLSNQTLTPPKKQGFLSRLFKRKKNLPPHV